MAKKLPIRTHRARTVILIAASFLIIGGVAAATVFTLKRFAPVKKDIAATSDTQQSPADAKRDQANTSFAKGKYTDALAQYKEAYTLYTNAGDTSSAADMKQQVEIVEATIKNTPPAPTQPRRGINGGGTK